MKVAINISHDEKFEHYMSMLHNDAVRLAKTSVEKFRKVAFIPSHIQHYRSHMWATGKAGSGKRDGNGIGTGAIPNN